MVRVISERAEAMMIGGVSGFSANATDTRLRRSGLQAFAARGALHEACS